MELDKAKLDILEREILECGKWAVEKQKDLHVMSKEDHSPVTEVDLGISTRILSLIDSLFPEAAIISEEHMTEKKDDAPYTFVLDPIDGTDVYSQGYPTFAIALGILDSSKTPVGAMIYAPRFGIATTDGSFLRLDPGKKLLLNGKEWEAKGDKTTPRQIAISSSTTTSHDLSSFRGKVRCLGSTILHIVLPVLVSGCQVSINEPCFIWDYAAAHAVILSQGMDLFAPDGTKYLYTEDFLNRKRSATTCIGGREEAVKETLRLCPPFSR